MSASKAKKTSPTPSKSVMIAPSFIWYGVLIHDGCYLHDIFHIKVKRDMVIPANLSNDDNDDDSNQDGNSSMFGKPANVASISYVISTDDLPAIGVKKDEVFRVQFYLDNTRDATGQSRYRIIEGSFSSKMLDGQQQKGNLITFTTPNQIEWTFTKRETAGGDSAAQSEANGASPSSGRFEWILHSISARVDVSDMRKFLPFLHEKPT
eukprot:TRINITY_DN5281_c0_g1_i1.p2 TRINITY_DN5281_c0_g1~~TRINITY_DN5281_c0_g1_i1.p2  ORF type:complete len:216 (+),score=86.58 TRINITY_DN5281_c0_g1_i1:26-649(+)